MTDPTTRRGRVQFALAVSLLAVASASLLVLLDADSRPSASLRAGTDADPSAAGGRQLLNLRGLLSTDPAAISDEGQRRRNCQFIYVLGVEGVGHHAFAPILRGLTETQLDPTTGMRYAYESPDKFIVQKTIFGYRMRNEVRNDPELVQQLLDEICPDDGRMHVLPLETSFPSKSAEDKYYPVRRQKEWGDLAMDEIAESETALNHPINLREFYETYAKHVDVKFVVLSQPFAEAVAHHAGFDGGPEEHLTVLSGYLLLLRRFVDWLDNVAGKGRWTLVCVEQLTEQFHDGNLSGVTSSRNEVVSNLAQFLKWPQGRCDACFEHWIEDDHAASLRKLHNRGLAQGKPHILQLVEMKTEVLRDGGVWPPPHPRRGQRQCAL